MAKTEYKQKKRIPPIEHRFKPGNNANPTGGRKMPAHLRTFRKMSYLEFLENLHKLGSMMRVEFFDYQEDPGLTMMEGIFSMMIKQAHEGDRFARTEILERLWGKVKEVHEIQEISTIKEGIKGLSPEKQEQLIDLLRQAAEAKDEEEEEEEED